jgi:hypothetical protein
MDGVTLLRRARDAGLQVEAAGEMLKITGPKRAEPVVQLLAQHKAEVLAALTSKGNELSYWQERYTARTFEWFNGKRDWNAARRIAWGDLQNEWHKRHGLRWPAWQCAGCEKPITGFPIIDMADGNRVHLEPIDCLIRFGSRWRGGADEALRSFGLDPPDVSYETRSAQCNGEPDSKDQRYARKPARNAGAPR